MASYKELDLFLEALNISTDKEPLDLEDYIKSKHKNITPRNREAIIRKLLKDGTIDFVIPNTNKEDLANKYAPNKKYYFISFEGIILIESGGYVKKINDDKKNKNHS